MTLKKDFIAGLLYLAIAAAAFFGLGETPSGTLARMGPGYFPKAAAAALAAIGLVLMIKSALRARDEEVLSLPMRLMPVLTILGSGALYAALLPHAGFLPSTALMVFLSTLAHPAFHWKTSLILSVALTAGCALLFVCGMGLIVPLWPVFGG